MKLFVWRAISIVLCISFLFSATDPAGALQPPHFGTSRPAEASAFSQQAVVQELLCGHSRMAAMTSFFALLVVSGLLIHHYGWFYGIQLSGYGIGLPLMARI